MGHCFRAWLYEGDRTRVNGGARHEQERRPRESPSSKRAHVCNDDEICTLALSRWFYRGTLNKSIQGRIGQVIPPLMHKRGFRELFRRGFRLFFSFSLALACPLAGFTQPNSNQIPCTLCKESAWKRSVNTPSVLGGKQMVWSIYSSRRRKRPDASAWTMGHSCWSPTVTLVPV